MRMKDRSGVSSVHSHSYLPKRTAKSMRPRLFLRVARSESHEDEGACLRAAIAGHWVLCLFSIRVLTEALFPLQRRRLGRRTMRLKLLFRAPLIHPFPAQSNQFLSPTCVK